MQTSEVQSEHPKSPDWTLEALKFTETLLGKMKRHR